MPTSLLIGNGINRVSNKEASWEHFLKELSGSRTSAKKVEHLKHKPFSLVFEEVLLSRDTGYAQADEFAAKSRIASLANQLETNKYHGQVMSSGLRHILTTNYEYGFEKASGLESQRVSLARETKYSLYRRRAVGKSFVWHIHGESGVPNSITLGYDQYCGYLQALRAYATGNSGDVPKSPFKRGIDDFDSRDDVVYSWLDVFLRDDLHIVGLGLDYTEIDLWWALTYKARLRARGHTVGKTFFYDWYSEPPDDYALAKRSLLQSLAVVVRDRDCSGGFETAYDSFIASL
jgi:hypothetical protein